jgi:hypothetical protein
VDWPNVRGEHASALLEAGAAPKLRGDANDEVRHALLHQLHLIGRVLVVMAMSSVVSD